MGVTVETITPGDGIANLRFILESPFNANTFYISRINWSSDSFRGALLRDLQILIILFP